MDWHNQIIAACKNNSLSQLATSLFTQNLCAGSSLIEESLSVLQSTQLIRNNHGAIIQSAASGQCLEYIYLDTLL